MTCETVNIISETAPGGYVVINKSDFDPALYTVYEAPAAAESQADAENETPKPKGKSRKSDAD